MRVVGPNPLGTLVGMSALQLCRLVALPGCTKEIALVRTVTAHATTGTSKREGTPVITTGEVFSDGTAIELVSASADPSRPDLLLLNGKKATVARRVNHGGQIYEAPQFVPGLFRAIRWPARCVDYGSTRVFFIAIVDLFKRHLNLSDREASLLAYFCISTWLCDCLPLAPGLLISGPAAVQGIRLLRLLHCLCRCPLMLAEITRSGLRSLPMHLGLTLLINQPDLTPRMKGLLRASSYRGLYIAGREGELLDPFGPKVVFTGMDAVDDILGSVAIQLSVMPSQAQPTALDEQLQYEIANEFQPRLLMYRLKNHSRARECRFDVPEFGFPTREVARTLAACFPDDPKLRKGLVSLLRPQDEDVRAQRYNALEVAIVEVVLGLLHEKKLREVGVGELAEMVTALLRTRGEILQYSAEEVGWRMKHLNLLRKRNGAGMKLLLGRETSRMVHRWVRAYGITPQQAHHQDCPDCAGTEANAAQSLM